MFFPPLSLSLSPSLISIEKVELFIETNEHTNNKKGNSKVTISTVLRGRHEVFSAKVRLLGASMDTQRRRVAAAPNNEPCHHLRVLSLSFSLSPFRLIDSLWEGRRRSLLLTVLIAMRIVCVCVCVWWKRWFSLV